MDYLSRLKKVMITGVNTNIKYGVDTTTKNTNTMSTNTITNHT
jgi:hypothetical protein